MSEWKYQENCKGCGKKVGKKRAKGMCQRCYQIQYLATEKSKKAATGYRRKYYLKHKKEICLKTTKRNVELRMEMIKRLGGKCACCGEKNKEFLTLDHIKGGGRKEYKKATGPIAIYRQVKKEGFPKDKYRILCWNCNASLGLYGYCPHSNLTSPTYHSSLNHISWMKKVPMPSQ